MAEEAQWRSTSVKTNQDHTERRRKIKFYKSLPINLFESSLFLSTRSINLKETGRHVCKDLVAKASKRIIKVPQTIVKIRLDIKPED